MNTSEAIRIAAGAAAVYIAVRLGGEPAAAVVMVLIGGVTIVLALLGPIDGDR